jgi:hypothetical protein
MAVSDEAASSPEQQIALQLNLLPGDIVFSEMPYDDARFDDFTHFDNLSPGHTCVWVNGHTVNAFARSHQEGYQPPGLTLTGLWPGRHSVYRYIVDADIAKEFAAIMTNWASQDKSGLPSGMLEQRAYLSAANDLFALFRNQHLANLGSEGLRRAIKFASQRALIGEPEHRSGQRCTAIVAAAFQASILAPIVKHQDNVSVFQRERGSLFLEYADLVMEAGWREHPLGGKLLSAANKQEFSTIFPAPFAVDQRYATPKLLYHALSDSVDFCRVGQYSYFNQQIIAVEKSTSSNLKISSQNRQ